MKPREIKSRGRRVIKRENLKRFTLEKLSEKYQGAGPPVEQVHKELHLEDASNGKNIRDLGIKFFDQLDKKSTAARRIRSVYLEAVRDMGGERSLSVMQRRNAFGWAGLTLLVEKMMVELAERFDDVAGDLYDYPFNGDLFISLNRAASNQAKLMGLARVMKNVTDLDLKDFVKTINKPKSDSGNKSNGGKPIRRYDPVRSYG